MKNLRLIACGLLALAPSLSGSARTTVGVEGDNWLINGQPTCAGRMWKGYKIEGLLMNSRMVQGVFDSTAQ
ncbi:MAG: hypothetical protein ABIZ81_08970 [Opitutaceae bacterium]